MGLVAGAAIGGAASLGGAMLQSNAASQASDKQSQAAGNALSLQKDMFGQAKDALSPGYSGLQGNEDTLNALLTPGTSADALSKMPGFQFQSDWGTKAAQNTLAAQGLGGSTGPLAKAVSDYNNGLAGTYYQNTTNALQNKINSGVQAGSALAGNATNTGIAMGNTQQNIGNAQASGILGSANALSGGLSGAGNGIGNAMFLSSILGQKNADYNPAGGLYGVSTLANSYGNFG